MIDTLFGSKTRVKLLYLFFNNPGRAFYVREITRRVDEQINSVRRELANMLSIGVIKSSNSDDNKLYYEVDQNYKYFSALKQIFADKTNTNEVNSDVNTATDWTKRTKKLTGARLIILSGSFVTGARSGVDVLMVGTLTKGQVKKFIADLEEDEHRSLNYATMLFDDFYYRLSVKDRFIYEIVNDHHIPILDTDGLLKQPPPAKE